MALRTAAAAAAAGVPTAAVAPGRSTAAAAAVGDRPTAAGRRCGQRQAATIETVDIAVAAVAAERQRRTRSRHTVLGTVVLPQQQEQQLMCSYLLAERQASEAERHPTAAEAVEADFRYCVRNTLPFYYKFTILYLFFGFCSSPIGVWKQMKVRELRTLFVYVGFFFGRCFGH